MDHAPGTTLVSTSRANWGAFAAKLAGIGRGDVAAYVAQMSGCSRAQRPSIPLDRERYALWQDLMSPICPACGLGPDWHDGGRCPEPEEAA